MQSEILGDMKFKSISATDKRTGWNVENIQFNSMLTLLVGASGVGKTKILNVIKALTNISNGESYNGLKWRVEFLQNEHDYIWEGEFDSKNEYGHISLDLGDKDGKVSIINELIIDNGEILVKRSSDAIFYQGNKLVKLDNTKSIVELLKEEPLIEPIYKGFQQCYDLDTNENKINFSPIVDVSKRPLNLMIIKALKTFSPIEKLFLLYEKKMKEFDIINQKFQDIFPNIEGIDFTVAKSFDGQFVPILRIKEKNVVSWIDQLDISSGMMRTLLQIITLVLANDGDVIMIDEFENGLGVNCINELADLIMEPEANIQVVMTSHHPYIINAIPVKDWKILTRNGSDVQVHTAEELHIGEHSKHEAFMQLLQTPEYKTGIRN